MFGWIATAAVLMFPAPRRQEPVAPPLFGGVLDLEPEPEPEPVETGVHPLPPLERHEPLEHADQLLEWLTTGAQAYQPGDEIVHGEICEAYHEMCAELWWEPVSWLRVARYLTPRTGGKKYRNVVDPVSGRLTGGKERIYRIQVPEEAGNADSKGNNLRRAA